MINHAEKMPVFIKRIICICLCVGLISSWRTEISFRKAKTRLEWMEGSVTLWSGVAASRGHCCSLCSRSPKCVSLVYINKSKFCKLLDLQYKLDDTAQEDDTEYFIIDRLPESCADLANCSGTNTDGEYWLYPNATSGQRVKVYCHNMGTNPTEYITLKHANTFVEHDSSNWIIQWEQCQSSYKTPLKQANFAKIAINIQNMTIHGYDYTFAVRTGNFNLAFAESFDCNGDSSLPNCPHFGDAVINTRGTGVILDPNVDWGLIKSYKAAMLNFKRSEDGAEISFTCAGWCGVCGPLSQPLTLILSSENVSGEEAKTEVCTM